MIFSLQCPETGHTFNTSKWFNLNSAILSKAVCTVSEVCNCRIELDMSSDANMVISVKFYPRKYSDIY
ncbi:hypothetical protein CS542_08425 [Pedobacter sp. IW39]|nr:hypothetical protein CS542_08425 [Pedobacter sp. IW39]